jgi:hypothetical protein
MAFTIDQFIRARPYVFHLTARANKARIRRTGMIDPASHLLAASGQQALVTVRRRTCIDLPINGEVVQVRDQAPLHAGNIAFEGGWQMPDVIQELNERVFFWPGSKDRAIAYAHRHFARYGEERPVVLRASLETILLANANHEPGFCRFNSGSPRCSSGRKSPRGPSTFLRCADADFRCGQVVEVTFRGTIALPPETEWADSYDGPWQGLF